MTQDEIYMQRCLQLAALGKGWVAPNPMVGAVLVHNGRIIGEGWHQQYGQAHAEINCFESVSNVDKHLIPGSTLYVSLEPCAHYGKTPPCAHRIIGEKVQRVVVGTPDPFEAVNGRGITLLQEAGIQVTLGVLEGKCRWQNRRFFTFHEKKRPFVHLKWAATADGFMSGTGGKPIKITGPITNRLVHRWRRESTAIMVGSGTALADNPLLTARYGWVPGPLRVLVDRNLKVPSSNYLLSDGHPTIVLNLLKDDVLSKVQWVKISDSNPIFILQALYRLGIQSVLVEGGRALLNSFIESGNWDEAHVLTATKELAGEGTSVPIPLHGKLKSRLTLVNDQIDFFVKQ